MMETVYSVSPLLYLLVPVAFLLGSIPFGILFTRSRGIDIRSTGSKNIGATNVLRAAGKMPAFLTLLADVLKGTVAVILCQIVLMKVIQPYHAAEFEIAVKDLWLGIISLTAVLGHMYSIFLKFRGGKGVATGFGVMFVYSPAVAGIMLLIWILAALTFKYSSLSAIISFSLMPVLFVIFGVSVTKVVIGALLALIVIYKHRTNIRDLINRAEEKIGEKNNE
jgi:glycerol-3-phosphate acyltransferase PlsY